MTPPPAKKPIPTVMIVVIVIAIGGLTLLGTCGGFALYFWKSKDRLIAVGAEGGREGMAWAKDHDQRSCVDESLRRNMPCKGDFACQVSALTFQNLCLERAAKTPDLCTDVPRPASIFAFKSWTEKQCEPTGQKKNEPCLRLAGNLATYCSSDRAKTR